MAQISEAITRFLEEEIARGAFPGAQYLIGEGGEIVCEGAVGNAVIEPQRIPVRAQTIYDLASLTKPLVTALLAVKYYQRGLLDIEAPASLYLDELKEVSTESFDRLLTVKRLLTHTSGLPAWQPLYLKAAGAADTPRALARISADSLAGKEPPQQVEYSDIGYILLGYLIERLAGATLDHIARKEIFEPLKLERTMFNPPPELISETAATEHGQKHERGSACAEGDFVQSENCPLWRNEMIWGKVHDGNAYFLGGVAGHAGLFSTARDVFRIANEFLPGSVFFNDDSLRLFEQNLTEGRGSNRSIGWVLASTSDCSAGPSLPPRAFGHTGFTGTSLWIDPVNRRVFALLTNRVHPTVCKMDMKATRQRFNTIAAGMLDTR